jgi:hypothetical protein
VTADGCTGPTICGMGFWEWAAAVRRVIAAASKSRRALLGWTLRHGSGQATLSTRLGAGLGGCPHMSCIWASARSPGDESDRLAWPGQDAGMQGIACGGPRRLLRGGDALFRSEGETPSGPPARCRRYEYACGNRPRVRADMGCFDLAMRCASRIAGAALNMTGIGDCREIRNPHSVVPVISQRGTSDRLLY